MGFLSKLFGGNKEEKALKEAFEHTRRVIEDEQFQLDMLNPMMKNLISSRPVCDRNPEATGPFGFCETNPIPVNGPIGELAYLSKLETERGERIIFHRIGAINSIDVFEAVTFSGNEWFILFLDMYHPRKSRLVPEGFHFTKDVAQFSGFHKFCVQFPYDFIEMKRADNSGLSLAYIPISKISQQLQREAFKRPLAHNAKLDIVKARLTSISYQTQ